MPTEILYAIPLGLSLSFAAGPVFFVIIETSISKGKLNAFILDLGAILADILFIGISYFGSRQMITTLKTNPWIVVASGIAVMLFGGFYIVKSQKSGQFRTSLSIEKKRFFFIKGFLLNFLNIGVLLYWLATTVAIGSLVDHDEEHLIIFYVATIVTYLVIDLFKIYFANKFKERLQGKLLQKVERIMGFIFIGFGIFLVVRNLFFSGI